MKIGLLNLEPKINNTALMKISKYHKDLGDDVEMYIDFFRNNYDKIYCSSLFNFTDKSQVPENAICGGTGFDTTNRPGQGRPTAAWSASRAVFGPTDRSKQVPPDRRQSRKRPA